MKVGLLALITLPLGWTYSDNPLHYYIWNIGLSLTWHNAYLFFEKHVDSTHFYVVLFNTFGIFTYVTYPAMYLMMWNSGTILWLNWIQFQAFSSVNGLCAVIAVEII